MRMINRFLLVLIFFISGSNLHAQIVHAGDWTGYQDGITVGSIALRNSIMYVNTFIGTARVDPLTHEYTYLHDLGNPDLPDFIDLNLSTIDSSGRLWMFQNQQLVYIDTDLSIHVAGPEPKYLVTSLKSDLNGGIWAGFFTPYVDPKTGEAIAKFNGLDWEYIDVGALGLSVEDIAFDGQNNPWFTAGSQMYRFNGSAFEVVKDNGAPVFGSSNLAISNDGRVAGAGGFNTSILRYFNKTSWKTIHTIGFSYPVFDENNILWLSDRYGSLYRMDENDMAPQLVINSAINFRTGDEDYVTGMGLDQTGQLWIGRYNGLFVAQDKTINQFDFVPLTDLLVPAPHPYVAAHGDTTWLATGAGITRLINDQFEKINVPQTNISAIFYDEARKGLWVGSAGMLGFYKGDSQTLININPLLKDSIFYNKIHEIKGDGLGNIWFRLYEGLLRYNPSGEWKPFFIGSELPVSPNGAGYFSINNKDNSVWIRTNRYSMGGFLIPPRLLKITGDLVTDTHFDVDILNEYGAFAVISDSVMWFSGYPDVLLYDHGVKTEYIPGTLNNEEFIVYNDSTILLCSNFGLYVFKSGQWFKPVIPSDRIFNDDVYPAFLTSEGKLLMANYPLLVIGDLDDLLSTLTTAVPQIEIPELHYFPNPVHDFLHIDPEFIQKCPDCRAGLFALNGVMIKSYPDPLPSEFDLSSISAGFYLFQIRSGEKLTRTLKVIKN